MYFWNVDQLVKDLRANVVSEYEKMIYLLGTIVLYFMRANSMQKNYSPELMPFGFLVLQFLFILELCIIIWGVFHCYRMNARGDNKNFIERFIIIGFPLSIKFMVLFLALFFLGLLLIVVLLGLGFALAKMGGSVGPQALVSYASSKQQLIALIFMVWVSILILSVSILYYYILGKKIAAVSNPKID